MKRILLAGLLGGLALFAWESVAHMVLPLGEAGIRALSNEQAVMSALKDNIRESGFYFFPAPEDRPGMTAQQKSEAMSKAEEQWRTGPAGIMVFHPNGSGASLAAQLVMQLVFDIAAMWLAALLLARIAGGGYLQRVLLVTLMGLFPTVQSELPTWNWYGFPTTFMLAQSTVHLVGFLAGGLVLAKLVKPEPAPGRMAAPLAMAS